jgi:hypothetical protein
MPTVEFEAQRLPQYGVAFVPETFGRSNIGDKSDPFELTGGRYAVRCQGSAFNVVVLETVDSLPVVSFNGDGADILDLPAGRYQVTIA